MGTDLPDDLYSAAAGSNLSWPLVGGGVWLLAPHPDDCDAVLDSERRTSEFCRIRVSESGGQAAGGTTGAVLLRRSLGFVVFLLRAPRCGGFGIRGFHPIHHRSAADSRRGTAASGLLVSDPEFGPGL